ncbi:MAG: POTRA domain-containing protein [Nevskia sp.]|nr:POTRA domain-containing protein [Nevskia sp.]
MSLSVSIAQADPAAGAAPTAAPGAAAKLANTFDIFEYRVEGNSVLKTEDIENAVYPYLGESKGIKDIEAARRDLEKAYHDHGYLTVVVNIPPQKIVDNVVVLKVVEAPVGKLTVIGSRYHSLEVIKGTVPELAEGTVPDFNQVQKELADLNRTPDRSVTPVLRASQTPGQVDVDLQVKDQLPLHASVDLNNHYSANTSHLRLIGDVHYDNLFQAGHSVDLQYQTSPLNSGEVEVWSLSYVIPTSGSAAWALYAVRSNSNVAAVGALDVIGNGDIFGVRLIEPLAGGDAHFYHSISAGFDYKNFKQDVMVEGSDTGINTPVHYLPFTVQYSANWLQAAPQGSPAGTPGSSTGLNLGLSFAIRDLATNDQDFDNKRFGASASYMTLHPTVQRLQMLPRGWSLLAKLDGQFASGPLISNEQYTAGGSDSVRGYLESERLGDQGFRGNLELRTPGLLSGYSPRIEQSYVFAFAEAAKLQVLDALPGQDSHFSLASVGLGMQFKARGLTVHLDGAHTLSQGYVTDSNSNRGLFEVSYGF